MATSMIFHVPFALDEQAPFGNSIRPLRMLEAFRSLGTDVVVIQGDGRERREAIKKLAFEITKGRRFDFVYSESGLPTSVAYSPSKLPKHPTMDLGFLARCRAKGIPVGLFHRDIHWRFPELELYRSALRHRVLNLLRRADLLAYHRCVSRLYLPALSMARHVPHIRGIPTSPLPPGSSQVGTMVRTSPRVSLPLRLLYVGGMGKLYDLSLFVRTITRSHEVAEFTLCTREADWIRSRDSYPPLPPNMRVVHESGARLEQLYAWADVCVLFPRPTPYWEFAMPVKTFEYISNLKPILAVRGTQVADLVRREGIGWTADFNQASLEKTLSAIVRGSEELSRIHDRLVATRAANTWEARAKQVSQELTGE